MKGFRLAVAALVVLSPVVVNADQWDNASFGDDTITTYNHLVHGANQQHVIQGDADNDYARLASRARRSYEIRLALGCPITSGPGAYIRFTRVDQNGVLIQTPSLSADGLVATLRWAPSATVTQWEYLKGEGLQNLNAIACPYVVEFYDTTLFAPRWNNAGGQVTVFIVQNTTDATVTGTIWFYDSAGSVLGSGQAFSIPADGAYVINTATVPGLSGQSGVAAISHLGGWGGLTGKAVAIDAANGFSFDTPFNALPATGPHAGPQ